MMYHLPPLPALQAFEAAARHENFAAAAKELNLSQSAVSHRVRALERHLGHRLFERLPRGLRLTETGKAFLPSVRKAFEELGASASGLFGPTGARALTVRAPVSYSALWIAPALESFLAAYPGTTVRLCSSVWADQLANEEVDVELRLGFGIWTGVETELVLRESVVPLCSPAALDQDGQINGVEDLVARDLIHVMGLEDIWMRLFSERGLSSGTRRRDVRVDSTVAALELAANSRRFALLPRKFLGPYLEAGRLTLPLELEVPVDQGLYLLRPEGTSRRTPEAIQFRDWLIELAAQD